MIQGFLDSEPLIERYQCLLASVRPAKTFEDFAASHAIPSTNRLNAQFSTQRSFPLLQAPTSDPVIAKLRQAFNAMEAEFKTYTDSEKGEVIKLGGLHVVGTERHESRRIDNQVRGGWCQ